MNQSSLNARVHYFERQYLRRQDLADEQAYHLAMRRRHNIAHHTWGIVSGLEIVQADGDLFVNPGLAVDRFGRELVVQHRMAVPLAGFETNDGDALHVWLYYGLIGAESARSTGSGQAEINFADCDKASTEAFYRYQEQPRLVTTSGSAEGDGTDPQNPPDVTEFAQRFAPHLMPPDDPNRQWPVYLGKIVRHNEKKFSVFANERPQAGIVGGAIQTPSGQTTVVLGGKSDSPRFAVRTIVRERDEKGKEVEKEKEVLAIDGGGIEVHGRAVVEGDMEVQAGALVFSSAEKEQEEAAEQAAGLVKGLEVAPKPWRIYRVNPKEEVPDSSAPDARSQLKLQQLRVELGNDAEKNAFVVGVFSAEDEAFQPILEVTDSRRTVIHGNLIVAGRVIEPNVRTVASGGTPEQQRQTAGFAGSHGSDFLVVNALSHPDFFVEVLQDTTGPTQLGKVLSERPDLLRQLIQHTETEAVVKVVTWKDPDSVTTAAAQLPEPTLQKLLAADADLVVRQVVAERGELVIEVLSEREIALSGLINVAPEAFAERLADTHLETLVTAGFHADPEQFTQTVVEQERARVADALLADEAGINVLVDQLAADPERVEQFLAILQRFDGLSNMLAAGLRRSGRGRRRPFG